MFSEELKILIDAAIADGEITEKERALLHKRAIAEGVDVDELDMIIDAKIVKNKKEIQAIIDAEPAGESTLAKFLNTLQEINNTSYSDIKKSFWEDGESMTAEEQKEEAILNAIRIMYIPSKKKDFVEILLFLKSQSQKKWNDFDDPDELDAYKDKYKEACEKAKVLFPGDKEIESIIFVPEKDDSKKTGKKKGGFLSGIFGK